MRHARILPGVTALAAVALLFTGCRNESHRYEPFVELVIPVPASTNPAVDAPTASADCLIYLARQVDLRDVKFAESLSPRATGRRRYELKGTGTIDYRNNLVTISTSDVRINGQSQKGQTYCSYVFSPDGTMRRGFLRDFE